MFWQWKVDISKALQIKTEKTINWDLDMDKYLHPLFRWDAITSIYVLNSTAP